MDDSSFIKHTEKVNFIIRYVTNYMSTNMGSSTDPKAFQIGLDNAKRSAELAWEAVENDNLIKKLYNERWEKVRKDEIEKREILKKQELLRDIFRPLINDICDIENCISKIYYNIRRYNNSHIKNLELLENLYKYTSNRDNIPDPIEDSNDIIKNKTMVYKDKAKELINFIDGYDLLNEKFYIKRYYLKLNNIITEMNDVETYI